MSNENKRLDYEDKIAVNKLKKEEITNWAREYIDNNIQRIYNHPSPKSATDWFTTLDWEDVVGMSDDEMGCLREALTAQFALKKKQLEQLPIQALQPPYGNVGPHQQYGPVQPVYGQPPRGQPFAYDGQNPPQYQQHPHQMQMVGSSYPQSHGLSIGGEQFRGGIVPGKLFPRQVGSYLINIVHPVHLAQGGQGHPPHQGYSQFMEQQARHLDGRAPPKSRGQSNEAARNGRGKSNSFSLSNICEANHGFLADQRNSQNNNYSNNHRNNGQRQDRRSSSSYDPRGNQPQMAKDFSPVNSIPIYVKDAQPRTFSDPLTGRKGVSNDARQWEPTYEKRPVKNESHFKQQKQSQKPAYIKQSPDRNSYDMSVMREPPFANDRMARVNDKSSTYYYSTQAFDRSANDYAANRDYYQNRTLYVTGVNIEQFCTHYLREVFQKYGTVDAISYLYPNQQYGTAFIM